MDLRHDAAFRRQLGRCSSMALVFVAASPSRFGLAPQAAARGSRAADNPFEGQD